MGVRFPGSGNNTIVNASIVTNAATIVAVSNLLNLAIDFQQVLILWMLAITWGASTTAAALRLRRGSTTAGTLLNVAPSLTVVAAQIVQYSGTYVDTPGAVANQQYAIEVQTTGATANHAVQDVNISAVLL